MFYIYIGYIVVTKNLINQNICEEAVYKMADPAFAPSQWETALLGNGVSRWLGASVLSGTINIEVAGTLGEDTTILGIVY